MPTVITLPPRSVIALAGALVATLLLPLAGRVPALAADPSPAAAAASSLPGAATEPAPTLPQAGIQLDPAVTMTSLVTADQGGYLSLFAPDGSMYALTVPPHAVLSDIEMTMTLATAVTRSPLGDQLVGGVDLGPSGLQLIEPAMLTITPATPLSVAEEGPFTARTDGAGFQLTPLTADPSTFTMPILHFTVFGLMKTDAAHRDAALQGGVTDAKTRFAQEQSQALQDAREHGGTIDVPALEARFEAYRDGVVVPLMTAAEADPGVFWQAFNEWLARERQRQLWNLDGAALGPGFLDSLRTAFATYVEHTKARCDQHDLGVIVDFLRLEQLNQQLGLGFDQEGDAMGWLDGCLTFTLEMDAVSTAKLDTCVLIDTGSHLSTEFHLRASVVLKGLQQGPWTGPMQWVTGKEEGECHIRIASSFIDGKVRTAGVGDAGVLTVLGWKPDVNIVSQADGQTVAEMRLRHLVVQPGDPKLTLTGDSSVLIAMQQHGNEVSGVGGKNSETSTQSIDWPRDFGALSGGTPVGDPDGGAWDLGDWVPSGEGDVIATREHSDASHSDIGDTTHHLTLTLRHTPVH
ncbi:MAG: hypothetical protein U0869_17565 [Chloroflexota bacterium]